MVHRRQLKQKKTERREAFLNAQKQLLKTSEYIGELNKLSHELANCINKTSQLFENEYIPNYSKNSSVVGCKDMNDIVSFHSKKRRISSIKLHSTTNDNDNKNNEHDNNDNDNTNNNNNNNHLGNEMKRNETFDLASYNINPLINSLSLIDSGKDIFSMHIDVKVERGLSHNSKNKNKNRNKDKNSDNWQRKSTKDIDILSKTIDLDSSDMDIDSNYDDNLISSNNNIRKNRKKIESGLKRVSYMSHLMNNIDIPFLSSFQDLQLLVDNVQSCLYSSTIILPISELEGEEQRELEAEVFARQRTTGSDVTVSTKNRNVESNTHHSKFKDFGSFIQSREVLVNKLVSFLISYAQNSNEMGENENDDNKNENGNNSEKNAIRKRSLFESILPHCFYSLVVILYQSSQLCENQRNNSALSMQSKQIAKQFVAFVQHLQKQIENVMEKCFEMLSKFLCLKIFFCFFNVIFKYFVIIFFLFDMNTI